MDLEQAKHLYLDSVKNHMSGNQESCQGRTLHFRSALFTLAQSIPVLFSLMPECTSIFEAFEKDIRQKKKR